MIKFQAPNKFPCLPAGRNDPIIKRYRGVWNLNIGYYLVIDLPARSPASKRLAKGRRFGEGRYLVIGACSPLYMKTEVDDITVSDEIFFPFRSEKSFFFCQMFGATGDEIIE